MYYNFCRIHQTLRVTPAIAAGVTDRAWDVEDEDIVGLLELQEAEQHEQWMAQRGPVLGHGA